ncbi:hypothetical protein G9A89_004841 [Geosiphon pyriformis]|nr:hypothetical protein G9A89_004841 [Geosiphon pyriformis]
MATLLLLLHKRQQQLAITMKTIFEPERPLIPNTRLDLNALDEGTCVAFFRFNKTQIEQLVEHFRIPSVIITENRLRATGVDSLCMLLRRMAYPKPTC